MKNCMLFKHGDAVEIKGVKCEYIRVEAKAVDSYLKQGYVKSLSELKADTNKSGKLSNEEIRQAAKEAGLDNWEKGRIKGLKEALGYE
jgi:hypothetical protein